MNNLYSNYVQALKTVPAPALFLDLEAIHKNSEWVTKNAGSKKIRIATKSVRSVEILKMIHASSPVFQGFMTFTLEESLWLRSQGLKDILMGYPTTDRTSLEKLAEAPGEIVLMVDRIEHLDLLEEIAKTKSSSFDVCIDMDLSMDLPGVRFGVYRSNLQTASALEDFLAHLKKCPHIKLIGAMGYEAQIAGVMDEKAPLIKILKKLSLKQLKNRRNLLVNMMIQAGHKLRIINGGGTGSLKHTVTEAVVNEVTVGSAFYGSVLFDHYEDFKLTPALFFSSPIVRQPAKDIFTILGGGFIASGSTGDMKQPKAYLPTGLSLIKNEGAGEVQTPLKYSGDRDLKIGDIIILRHAKAGEVCERFNEIYLIEKDKLLKSVKTYRGEGKAFL